MPAKAGIQYSIGVVMKPKSRGVLDHPLLRMMTFTYLLDRLLVFSRHSTIHLALA